MKKYGENDNKKIWVWFSTYEPLDDRLEKYTGSRKDF